MALTVENGTGLADADSYVSVTGCTSYATKYGLTDWAEATEGDQEIALRVATMYIDGRYRFKGEPLTDTQALEWPREDYAWPQKRVVDACCELAVRSLTQPLYSDVEELITEETIGPLTTKYANPTGQVEFTQINDMLKPLTVGALSTIKLIRG